jgi:hypothetical protein
MTSLTADVQRSTTITVLQTATPRPDLILQEDDWVLGRTEESERGLVTGLFSWKVDDFRSLYIDLKLISQNGLACDFVKVRASFVILCGNSGSPQKSKF